MPPPICVLDRLPARGALGRAVEFLGIRAEAGLGLPVRRRLACADPRHDSSSGPPGSLVLARYDFLFLAALAIQLAMLAFQLETLAEAKVILIFHIVGTVMEIFKTSAGSWIYPEAELLPHRRRAAVFGFMYAAVGSYLARILRIFDIRYSRYPPAWTTVVLRVAIYANFFAHHFIAGLRATCSSRRRLALSSRTGGTLPRVPLPPPDAAAARLPARRAVHLVCREHRHLVARLALSRPGGRWTPVSIRQARRLVSADDHLVRAGVAGSPPTAAGRDGLCRE